MNASLYGLDTDERSKGYAHEALVLGMAYGTPNYRTNSLTLFCTVVQKFNVNHFFVKVLSANKLAFSFFEKHGFRQEGDEDVFREVRLGLPADSLPRTELHIVHANN